MYKLFIRSPEAIDNMIIVVGPYIL